jgi:hypothetical protein
MEEYMKGIAGVRLARSADGHNKPSPVRMRREVVAGTYDNVKVSRELYTGKIIVSAVAQTSEELRESAHIFNQIAEVLEENAK